MRLIDADALIKKLNEERIPYNSDINYLITTAPTIEEKKQGEWYAYDRYNQWMMHYKCSECNVIADDSYNYCPHCGAKMNKEIK